MKGINIQLLLIIANNYSTRNYISRTLLNFYYGKMKQYFLVTVLVEVPYTVFSFILVEANTKDTIDLSKKKIWDAVLNELLSLRTLFLRVI